jgi:hypothetical protein
MAWFELHGSHQEMVFVGAGYMTREEAREEAENAAITAKQVYSKKRKRLTVRTWNTKHRWPVLSRREHGLVL